MPGLPDDVVRVLVVGASRSGLAAALLLRRQGRSITLSDRKPREELPGIDEVEAAGVRILLGPQASDQLDGVDLLVKSPGVPTEATVVAAAHAGGIPVWSELELAYALMPNPFTAITGTNGKTTTTALVGHIFDVAGMPARVLGNIGTAVTSVAGTVPADEELVVEASSFQLEDVHAFRPAAGVLLNLTQDHLDRHGTMERYLACKTNLFARQAPDDWAVINQADGAVAEVGIGLLDRADGPRVAFFSTDGPVKGVKGAREAAEASWLGEGWLWLLGDRGLRVADVSLRGTHNMENCLAGAAAALARGVPRAAVVEALGTFPGVPHRLQPVGVVDGVAYVNDSKATNVEATLKALGAYAEGTHLILGGRDKASDYRPIARACAGGCKGVYLIGEAAPLIEEAFARVRTDEGVEGMPVPRDEGDLERAVGAAAAAARPGDTVLLAPACASFDHYSGFEARGDHFVAIVKRMRDRAE